MDVMFSFIAIFIMLMVGVYFNLFLLYPLFIGLVLLCVVSMKRGFAFSDLVPMIVTGAKKCFLIIKVFMLIGAITAAWRASGTVAYIVYYGIEFMSPSLFVLYSFLLCCIVSFLLGTAFGTVGTIGVVLMIMARSGNVSTGVIAGAIIAGAYFGDRCSPMSSSANLVATITDTDLYKNIKNMMKTSYIPFALSLGIYTYLSFKNQLAIQDSGISAEILKTFNINPLAIIPAVAILLLALFRVDVKKSMLISIVFAAVIAVFIQKESVFDVGRYILSGYTMQEASFLRDILKGGGILSMVRVASIVLISSAYSGIFDGTGILKDAEAFIGKLSTKLGRAAATTLTSVAASSFGCTQTLAIILTNQLVKKEYGEGNREKLAVDLENTVIVIAPLIPWNIAAAVPAAALSVDSGFIVFACYLYLLPVCNFILDALREVKLRQTSIRASKSSDSRKRTQTPESDSASRARLENM